MLRLIFKGIQDPNLVAKKPEGEISLKNLVSSVVQKFSKKIGTPEKIKKNKFPKEIWMPLKQAENFIQLIEQVVVFYEEERESPLAKRSNPTPLLMQRGFSLISGTQVKIRKLRKLTGQSPKIPVKLGEKKSKEFEDMFQKLERDLQEQGKRDCLINFSRLAQIMSENPLLTEFILSSTEALQKETSFEALKNKIFSFWTCLFFRKLSGNFLASQMKKLTNFLHNALRLFFKNGLLYQEAFLVEVSGLLKKTFLFSFLLLDAKEYVDFVKAMQLSLIHI